MTAKNLIAPVALMLVVWLGVAPRAALADQGRGNGNGDGRWRGESGARAGESGRSRGREGKAR